MSSSPRQFFLCGVRFAFGIWLLYAGLAKWLAIGPENFIGYITNDFDKTWSPHALNVVLAWVILVAEPALALLLLAGKCPRKVWGLIALLMYMLLIGQTILMKPDVVNNWQFFLLALGCAALSGPPEECNPS